MLVLALYNLRGNEALLARQLAAVLKITVLEAASRLRSPGGGPAVIARFAEPAAAHSTAAALEAGGFDTLLLDEPAIESDRQRFVVRDFDLGAEAMTLGGAAQQLTVRYAQIDLLLRGFRRRWHQPPTPRPTRQLSLTRAVLSGGLVVSKGVPGRRPPAVEERESFLHLYGNDLPVLAWREESLHYRSLGAALEPARHANFARVVDELRRRCPGARYDDRLASSTGQAQLLGPALPGQESNDIAVSVLATALRRPAP